MKVCYISVFRDGTGYANQAIHNVLAMEAGGIDVAARTISLSQSRNYDKAKAIDHLEMKDTDGVDVVVQHVLPHLYEYKAGVKNVGLFCWETTHFSRSNWAKCCNTMDEIWVPSLQNVAAARKSGVTVPIKVFPCACDPSRFDDKPEPMNIAQLKNRCVFYWVGEMTRRKNIVAVLRAFYNAFTIRDDVILMVKASVPGQPPAEAQETLKRTTADIKKSMHTYIRHSYYPPVACITEFLPDDKLDQLHMAGDVFVMASHGEAINIPSMDAMNAGNPVILNNWGFAPELTYRQAAAYWESETQMFTHPGDIDCGWLVNGFLTPCFGHTDSFGDIYTGSESWFEPNICHLSECMKQAYAEWEKGDLSKRDKAAKKRVTEFNYDKVGRTARKLLDT